MATDSPGRTTATKTTSAELPDVIIRPQPGPQEQFLTLPPDVQIAIYGGAAGGGKTWALLMEPIYHIKTVRGFGVVIFRRTYTEITNEGGLWDESYQLYPKLGGVPNEADHSWTFPPYGNAVSFSHMQHEHDRFKWQGAQVPLFEFDELTTFEEVQFFYMLSRNRSTCGVLPYIRASCNPDADSWVAKFISWWIDADGFAIPERSGKLQYFVRPENELIWSHQVGGLEQLMRLYPDFEPLSVTFIPASLEDNQKLISKDPKYRGRLQNLPLVERERLLKGNWKIRPAAGTVFDRSWFETIPAPAAVEVLARVRYWDKAGTPGSGSWTAGVKMAVLTSGLFVVEHVVRGQWVAAERNKVMKQVAQGDGAHTIIIVEQEPGSGGKESAEISKVELEALGYSVEIDKVSGDKVSRAGPMSWHAEARQIKLVAGSWNEAYLAELYGFPDLKEKDQVDGSSGAFNKLKFVYDEVIRLGAASEPGDEIHPPGTFPPDELGGNIFQGGL